MKTRLKRKKNKIRRCVRTEKGGKCDELYRKRTAQEPLTRTVNAKQIIYARILCVGLCALTKLR